MRSSATPITAWIGYGVWIAGALLAFASLPVEDHFSYGEFGERCVSFARVAAAVVHGGGGFGVPWRRILALTLALLVVARALPLPLRYAIGAVWLVPTGLWTTFVTGGVLIEWATSGCFGSGESLSEWQLLFMGIALANGGALVSLLGSWRASTRASAARGAAPEMRVVRKAFAYVTHGERLLVFRHTGAPEAGIQVPAGTMRDGEEPAAAALREAMEETGWSQLGEPKYLGTARFDCTPFGRNELHERCFFHVPLLGDPPETWTHGETDPSEGAHSGPIEFEFFWLPIRSAGTQLIADHGQLLPQLIEQLQPSQIV